MKKLSLVAATLLTLGTLSIQADMIGGEIAIGGWSHNPGGWFKYPNYLPDNQSKLDLDNDLNLDTQTDLYIRAKLEHPIPILPNIRVAYQKLESSGDGQISRQFTFGDYTFNGSYPIHSDTTLNSYDATFYYEIIDSGIDLDLGLNARYIDGNLKIRGRDTTGTLISEEHDLQFVVPMLYANVRIPLPLLEGLSVGAEGSGITYDGNTLYDIQGDVRYIFTMGLGVEAGYRYQKLKIDDVDDTDADIDIQGFYGGIVWDF